MHICKYCKQERKNDNSLRNHERLCKLNPERKYTPFQDLNLQRNKKRSNQWVKAKENNKHYQIKDSTRVKLSEANKKRSKELNIDTGIKISNTVRKKVNDGTWHTSLAKHMHIDYNGVDLHGSWELKYAQYLDANNIKWSRNKDSFAYFFDGKERKYTPDFYLIDTDEYIEIKGYKTEKDIAKWSQFPLHRKLTVLLEKELKQLGIQI